jgi:phosphoglycolate phosphatase
MPLRGILFDKDGTLVDFRGTWLARYRGAAAELAEHAGGSPALATALLERLGYDGAYDRFAAGSSLLWATNDDIAAAWARMPELRCVAGVEAIASRHFGDHARYPPRPVGDVAQLCTSLRAAGFRLGLATMDSTANALDTMRRLAVEPLLDFVAGFDAGYGEKPEPGMVMAFCTEVGLRPAEVVLVGDTAADLRMARCAGCGLAVAVRTGGGPEDELIPWADHVIDDVHSLPGLLRENGGQTGSDQALEPSSAVSIMGNLTRRPSTSA